MSYIHLFYLYFQIHSEIDELHQHLQARRGSYGNSLGGAQMTSQAFKQFEMTVEVSLGFSIDLFFEWLMRYFELQILCPTF